MKKILVDLSAAKVIRMFVFVIGAAIVTSI
jgi:hypothetical protein